MAIYNDFDELIESGDIEEIKHQARQLLKFANTFEEYLIERLGEDNYKELTKDYPAWRFAKETAEGENL